MIRALTPHDAGSSRPDQCGRINARAGTNTSVPPPRRPAAERGPEAMPGASRRRVCGGIGSGACIGRGDKLCAGFIESPVGPSGVRSNANSPTDASKSARHVGPGFRGADRALPAFEACLDVGMRQRGREAAVELPLALQLVDIFPVADGEPREIRRAERRRFGDLRAHRPRRAGRPGTASACCSSQAPPSTRSSLDANARVGVHGVEQSAT